MSKFQKQSSKRQATDGNPGFHSELAELIAAQQQDAAGKTDRRQRVHADVDRLQVPDDAPKLGDVAHKSARPIGVRAGTERGTFHGTKGAITLDFAVCQTDHGLVDAHTGKAASDPKDWADVAATAIAGAKLAVISHLNVTRAMGELELQGTPDPRGPKLKSGEQLRASGTGLTIISADGSVTYYGRGEAHPTRLVAGIRASCASLGLNPPPAWLADEQRLAWLVELSSGGRSGGAGKLGTAALARLFRRPAQLRRHLLREAGKAQANGIPEHRELRSIATRGLPRSRGDKQR